MNTPRKGVLFQHTNGGNRLFFDKQERFRATAYFLRHFILSLPVIFAWGGFSERNASRAAL